MAVTQLYELDNVTIGTTEWAVAQNESFTVNSTSLNTDAAAVCLYVDTTNMAKTDEFEIRFYEKVEGTGGAQRLCQSWRLLGVQATNFVSPVLLVLYGWEFTLKKIAGTDRAFDASIRKAG